MPSANDITDRLGVAAAYLNKKQDACAVVECAAWARLLRDAQAEIERLRDAASAKATA